MECYWTCVINFQWKKLFRKNHRIPGNVWEASAHHSDNTNIDKCDKNILKDAITVYRDLCVSVAKVGGGVFKGSSWLVSTFCGEIFSKSTNAHIFELLKRWGHVANVKANYEDSLGRKIIKNIYILSKEKAFGDF